MRGQYVNILTARFYQSYIGGDVISGIIIIDMELVHVSSLNVVVGLSLLSCAGHMI